MVFPIWMIIWTKISDFKISKKFTPFLIVKIDWPFQSFILKLMHFQIRKLRAKILFETHVYYATLTFDVNYHFWPKIIILPLKIYQDDPLTLSQPKWSFWMSSMLFGALAQNVYWKFIWKCPIIFGLKFIYDP